MICEITRKEIPECVEVIRDSFMTVADAFDFTIGYMEKVVFWFGFTGSYVYLIVNKNLSNYDKFLLTIDIYASIIKLSVTVNWAVMNRQAGLHK